MSLPREPITVALFGNGVFMDVIKLKWGHPGSWWSRANVTSVLIRGGKFGHRRTGGMSWDDEHRIWRVGLRARSTKNCQLSSEARSDKEGSSPEASEGQSGQLTLWFRLSCPERWENTFLLLLAPEFVFCMIATQNKYISIFLRDIIGWGMAAGPWAGISASTKWK